MKTDVNISFAISKSFKEENKLIIAGYASVQVIDAQNEMIPIPVLKEAWERFKENKAFYFGSLMHTNIPVIKILDKYTDSKGQIWKSGVDDTGLFIIAEVRDDIEKGKQTRELVEKGALTGFSIGGEALASSVVCEGKCYTRIDKMDLHEIAVVDRPANQPSVFTIVKGERLKKLAELTEALPNLIISPGVAKIAGSTVELGQGHDFDVLIMATKGSFIDRAIQTRIHNELRKADRMDLWNSMQIIHEPEGLGPFTDFMDLYDLVLLRSPKVKKGMTLREVDRGKGTPGIEYDTVTITAIPDQVVGVEKGRVITKDLKEDLMENYDLNEGQVKLLQEWLGKDASKLIEGKPKEEKKCGEGSVCSILVSITKLDQAIEKIRSDSVISKSLSKLDKALQSWSKDQIIPVKG